MLSILLISSTNSTMAPSQYVDGNLWLWASHCYPLRPHTLALSPVVGLNVLLAPGEHFQWVFEFTVEVYSRPVAPSSTISSSSSHCHSLFVVIIVIVTAIRPIVKPDWIYFPNWRNVVGWAVISERGRLKRSLCLTRPLVSNTQVSSTILSAFKW